MKKFIFVILFFIQNFNSYSQNDSDNIQLPKFWIKTTPLHYIDPYNGTNYNFGLEYRLNDKISMNSEFGKILVWSPQNDHNGFYFRHEIKKYFPNLSVDREVLYVSGELSYSHQDFTRTDKINYNTSQFNDTTYNKTYFTVRNFIGLSGLFGSIREFDSGFIFEIMAGFGLRFNMDTNDLTDQESLNRELGDGTTPTNYLIKKGNHIIPRFHMGIKVGWRLSKK